MVEYQGDVESRPWPKWEGRKVMNLLIVRRLSATMLFVKDDI